MRPRIMPDLSECVNQILGRDLAFTVTEGVLYDEVGDPGSPFGWFGVLSHRGQSYIVGINRKNIFQYKDFPTQKSASKAWDHLCHRFEKWYQENNQ